ncbi:hypothetical protein [Candidatus Rariloculus sp.]|uniref:hypothetical protein n=1 Tax=Candidatus Rariloculus sp. TaxID=3101265 RepID=UPI003D0F3C02
MTLQTRRVRTRTSSPQAYHVVDTRASALDEAPDARADIFGIVPEEQVAGAGMNTTGGPLRGWPSASTSRSSCSLLSL